MSKFDDLRAIATERPLHGSDPQIVLSLAENEDTEWNSDDIAHGLWRFFKEDYGRTAVQLVISGEPAGYLNRKSFFEAGAQVRLGEAQSANLPGISSRYTFIQLKCPVSGCTAPLLLKAYYDQRLPPPRCPMHPDVALKAI
jgi:hypothetical protein